MKNSTRDCDNGKDNKRAERRAQKDKKKKQARDIYPEYDGAEKLADHLKNCSCQACCNPRKGWGEKTMQERRMELDQDDEFNDF